VVDFQGKTAGYVSHIKPHAENLQPSHYSLQDVHWRRHEPRFTVPNSCLSLIIFYCVVGVYMKYLVLIISIMLVGCSVNISNDQPISTEGSITKYRNSKSGIESIITNDALESFDRYSNASKHKAFAQSLSGAWVWIE
jgi:hypothetical protein